MQTNIWSLTNYTQVSNQMSCTFINKNELKSKGSPPNHRKTRARICVSSPKPMLQKKTTHLLKPHIQCSQELLDYIDDGR